MLLMQINIFESNVFGKRKSKEKRQYLVDAKGVFEFVEDINPLCTSLISIELLTFYCKIVIFSLEIWSWFKPYFMKVTIVIRQIWAQY